MRGWFLKRKPKNEKGFSIIEMVIAVPLIALSGGFIAMIIGQSVTVASSNQAINSAGVEIQNTMDKVRAAQNCYELEKAILDENATKIDNVSPRVKVVKKYSTVSQHPSDFKVETTLNNKSATTTTNSTKCVEYGSNAKDSQLIEVNSVAKSLKDERVLFKDNTTVLIRGN